MSRGVFRGGDADPVDRLARSLSARGDIPSVGWTRDARGEFARAAQEYGPVVAGAALSVLERTVAVEPGVTAALDRAVQGRGRLVGLGYRVKGLESLARKIDTKGDGSGVEAAQSVADRLTDVLRFTVESAHDQIAPVLVGVVRDMAAGGFEPVEIDDKYSPGAVYKGVHVLFRSSQGVVFEVQFHSPESLEVKDLNHVDYEVSRDPATPVAERERLQRLSRQRSAGLVDPPGLADVREIAGATVTRRT
jgi:hypothetical protein